ncbi:MAG: Holliday junction branch migration protein RuvA [Mycobacteriales bacterium]|nr:MAG: Holliday junction branch migration protein RuvA [Pseudonocardiales bacterium]
MIASVRGTVTAIGPDGVVVEIAGFGVAVNCTPTTLARLRVGEPARLATSLVVREDSLTLFGFADDDERATFELLQTASGVGPRLAQAVLGVHSPRAVRLAVATKDIAALSAVPGIGRKGAERMILELKDRIGSVGDSTATPLEAGVTPVQPWREQVGQALVGLGWSSREAEQAVAAVAPGADAGADVPALLRSALLHLGRS